MTDYLSPDLYYRAADTRYDAMEYRRTGRSGLKLPALSLGLWHNFGDDRALDSQRAILRRAFDLGVTHFDLANNYGPPPGSAELNFGKLFAQDFAPYRDELVISTKAGYLMHPGPYGEWGSRKYLLSSLDASLKRMGLDHVDIFYSHRFDPDTPLEETMGALASAVQQGKALYVGVSSYTAAQTAEAARLLREMGVPALIHQPSYSMINRWIEDDGLLDTLEAAGMGCISFVPLAQGPAHGQVPERHSGGLARHPGQVPRPGAALRRGGPPPQRARRHRARPRPVAGPARHRVGAAGQPHDVGADRGVEREAAGGERGGPRGPGAHRRGTAGDRRLRGGHGGRQHLGGPELTPSGRTTTDVPRRAAGAGP
ncbi:aryl-alcohol dehydrogenase-like predicted oxidoreductase [Streptomyces sp. V2I9]|nr:aryl-alcohol dehydrogenase-like predicted oxidoreductase [Streptomyces sp. V2I9]